MEKETRIFQSKVGPVIPVAEHSHIKPIPTGVIWGAVGGTVLAGVGSILAFELPRIWREGPEPEWPLVGIAGGMILVGYILTAILVRRVRAAFDKRLYFRAGPGGVSLCFPGGVKLSSVLLSYEARQHDLNWTDIKTWYAYVKYHGFIPIESQIVFEGNTGWEIRVDTIYFTGSRATIAQNIQEAIRRSDLVSGGGQQPEGQSERESGAEGNQDAVPSSEQK